MNELALFAGAGGGILGGHLLGWRTVCAVEWDAYAASVLLARQNDGILPPFPIWDDVQTFDGRPWRGIAQIVSGGFPCQDISCAGKGAGIDGERSSMWKHMARIIGEVRPRYAFIENSPMLVVRGLDRVLADLASMGYDAEWGIVSAADCGAPHLRERIWVVAKQRSLAKTMPTWEWRIKRKEENETNDGNTNSNSKPVISKHDETSILQGMVADTGIKGLQRSKEAGNNGEYREEPGYKQPARCDRVSEWREWPTEPGVGRVVNGMAARMDRLRCLGNGQVPRVAATAFTILSSKI